MDAEPIPRCTRALLWVLAAAALAVGLLGVHVATVGDPAAGLLICACGPAATCASAVVAVRRSTRALSVAAGTALVCTAMIYACLLTLTEPGLGLRQATAVDMAAVPVANAVGLLLAARRE